MATPLPSTIFGPAALQHLVERTLEDSPAIPEGKRGAFVTVANQDGVKAVVAVKIDDRWMVQAVVEKGWQADEKLTYGVVVTGTF